jgi:hypothetical protein
MPQSKIISRLLTVDGAAGTTFSMVTADATPITFSIKPSGSEVMEITRIIPFIEDSGGFYASRYGGMGAALTNGITMSVHNADGLVYTLTDSSHPIKSNADWTSYCYDTDYISYGQGDNMLVSRWTFAKSGKPVYLSASKGEFLQVHISDTISVVDHHMLVQGHYISQ